VRLDYNFCIALFQIHVFQTFTKGHRTLYVVMYWECEVGGIFFNYFALNQLLKLCSVALGSDCVT